MSEESKVSKLLTKTVRQKAAEKSHREKADAYRKKKIIEIQAKLALGTMQLIHGMKQAPWCARLELCFEILFKRENKNYNDVGEWIGLPEDRYKAPWCVRLFSKRVAPPSQVVRENTVDLSKESP